MELLEFEYINGFRSKSMLVYTTEEKQIYKKKNYYKNGTRYECYNNNCDVTIFIDEQNRCKKLKEFVLHAHPNQEALKDKMLLHQKMKDACKNAAQKGSSVRDIFDEVCQSEGNSANLVEYAKVKRNLLRIMNSKQPKSPTTHEDLQNMDAEDEENNVAKDLVQVEDVKNMSAEPRAITPNKKKPKAHELQHTEWLEYEYINGFRSSSVLVYTKDEQQIYQKNNRYNNGIRYTCYSKNCGASIFIDDQGRCRRPRVNDVHTHNHATQEELKEKMVMNQKIKNACKNAAQKGCTTKDVFNEVCQSEENAANLVEYHKMKRNLLRIKKSAQGGNQAAFDDGENVGLKRIRVAKNLLQSEEFDTQQTAKPERATQREEWNNMNMQHIYEDSTNSDEPVITYNPWPLGDLVNIDSHEPTMPEDDMPAEDLENIYSEESALDNNEFEQNDSKKDIKLFEFEQIDVCLHPKDPLAPGGSTHINPETMLLAKTPTPPKDLEQMNAEELTVTKYELADDDTNSMEYFELTEFTDTNSKEFFEFEYINGFRANSRLVYTKDEKQIYKKNNFYNNGTRYKCYIKNCNMSIFIDEQDRCRKLRDLHTHNHATQEELKNKMLISFKIKNACKNASLKRCSTRDIFEEECRNEENAAYLVQYEKMRRNLYRIKKDALQKNTTPPKGAEGTDSAAQNSMEAEGLEHKDTKSMDSAQKSLESADTQAKNSNQTEDSKGANSVLNKSTKKKSADSAPKPAPILLEFEYINGFRSSSMLVYTKEEKQIYRKHNYYNNGTRYECYNKNCDRSIFIDAEGKCRKLNDFESHNHPTQEILKDKMLLSQKLKNACKDPTINAANTRHIFEEALRNEKNALHLVEYEKIRGNLSRIRRSVMPKKTLPTEDLANTDLEACMPKHKLAKNDPKIEEFFEFEYITGNRGNSKLVYTIDEKQIYKRHNYYNKGTRYTCYSKKCFMSIFVDKYERCRKLSDVHAHNHPTQEVLRQKMLIRQKIREACKNAEEKECTARDVFKEALGNEEDSSLLFDFKQVKRNICRLKNMGKPKKPRVPKDLKNSGPKKPRKRKNPRQNSDLKNVSTEQSAVMQNIGTHVETGLPNHTTEPTADFTNAGMQATTGILNHTRLSSDLTNIGSAATVVPNNTRPNVVSVETRMPNNPWLTGDLKNIAAGQGRMSNNPWLIADLSNLNAASSSNYYNQCQTADLKNIYSGIYYR